MRITAVKVHRVNIALEAPYRWAPGWYHGNTKGIVEVYTDEDITGLGETGSLADAEVVESRLAPLLDARVSAVKR